MRPLHGIRACIFDAYGTIFDFATIVTLCTDIPHETRDALAALWREKQLQYTWLRTIQQQYVDFWQVTGDALDYALESLPLTNPSLRAHLMSLYLTPPVFPEIPGVLRNLRSAGFITAILSNGSMPMIESASRAAGVEDLIDVVLSADAVRCFKTHPRVYEHALERLALRPDQVSFQSSNAWDAFAASAFGMRVVWCNRYKQRRERLPGSPDHEVHSLAELPSLLEPPP